MDRFAWYIDDRDASGIDAFSRAGVHNTIEEVVDELMRWVRKVDRRCFV